MPQPGLPSAPDADRIASPTTVGSVSSLIKAAFQRPFVFLSAGTTDPAARPRTAARPIPPEWTVTEMASDGTEELID